MDGFFLPLSPPFSSNKISSFLPPPLFCRIATAQNFSLFPGRLFGLCEQKRDFDCFIHRSRISKRGRKISTIQRRGALSSLLFSSLLFSSLLSRNTKKKKKALHHRYTHEHTTRAMLTTTTMSTTGSSSSLYRSRQKQQQIIRSKMRRR